VMGECRCGMDEECEAPQVCRGEACVDP